MKLEKSEIANIVQAISDVANADAVELYQSLIRTTYEINSVNDFYFSVLYPYKQFVSGLIQTKISKDSNVNWIFQNSNYIESHFKHWIEHYEGSTCCVDKTRTIIHQLIVFYKDGKTIAFDHNQEYTYHLPKIVFTNHAEIVRFYEAILQLYYGRPDKYFEVLPKLTMPE